LNRKAISFLSNQRGDVMSTFIEKPQKDTGEIKTFQGIIPICTSCKNIWDNKGYWNHIEAHIREHPQGSSYQGTSSGRIYSLYLPRVCKKIYLESFQ